MITHKSKRRDGQKKLFKEFLSIDLHCHCSVSCVGFSRALLFSFFFLLFASNDFSKNTIVTCVVQTKRTT